MVMYNDDVTDMFIEDFIRDHIKVVTRQLWGKIPLWQRGNKGDFINIGKISPRPSFPKRGKYN
jgi:hypothetical protein